MAPTPAEKVAAAAAAASAAAPTDAPPSTPPPAAPPAAASDGAGAVAAAADEHDAASSTANVAQAWETPGTPGVQVTPLPRQRPVVQPRVGPLGHSPFMHLSTPGGASAPPAAAAAAEAAANVPAAQPAAAPPRKSAAPGRSRFAAAVENDEAAAIAALRASVERSALSSPGAPQARSTSFTTLAKREGSSSSLHVAARAASFTSFAGGSSGNLQLAARAASFTSFGGSRSNLSNIAGMASRQPSKALLDAAAEEAAGNGAAGAPEAGDQLQQLHL